MATKNPRLQVMLEPKLYSAVESLADEEGVSLSTKARDLIREAIEHLEDLTLTQIVEHRAKTSAKLLSLKEMEKRLGR